ncbi:hypothetical protein M1N16_09135 [Nitrospinaceae bacterium]|nr:hypothetical protein [Nitrospinaceae bacterium]
MILNTENSSPQQSIESHACRRQGSRKRGYGSLGLKGGDPLSSHLIKGASEGSC